MEAARPEKLVTDHSRIVEPVLQRGAGSLRQLKTNRLLRFALKKGCTLFDLSGGIDIGDLQGDQVTSTQFAVDGGVEQR